jgi:hypothetical protein
MILRRLSANLRAQNWTAIAIEFFIVVLGVFIGTQVANWNQARLEKQATNRMLDQLRPESRTNSHSSIPLGIIMRSRGAMPLRLSPDGAAILKSATTSSSSPPIRRARSTGSESTRRTGH